MSQPKQVNLGPLFTEIMAAAVWREKDEFPGSQAWADDIESVLAFLKTQGEFDRFRNRLSARERNGALAEARAGFYVHRKGFQILRWEPAGLDCLARDRQCVFGSRPGSVDCHGSATTLPGVLCADPVCR